jgi:hypothetical protein
MFLLGNEFSEEQKRRNFEYYDPLTTGDSSLSACVQSIIAAEVGKHREALEYFEYTLLMDLANVAGNVSDGVHIAAAAGVWSSLVFGFGGVRDFGGRLSVASHTCSAPVLPSRSSFRRRDTDITAGQWGVVRWSRSARLVLTPGGFIRGRARPSATDSPRAIPIKDSEGRSSGVCLPAADLQPYSAVCPTLNIVLPLGRSGRSPRLRAISSIPSLKCTSGLYPNDRILLISATRRYVSSMISRIACIRTFLPVT